MYIKLTNFQHFTFPRRAAFFAFILLAFSAFGAAATCAQVKSKKPKAKSAAPRTVTDFYMLLPAKYFPYVEAVKNRADLIEGEVLADGYLHFNGNRAFMPNHAEMLLLQQMNGYPLLVVSYTDCALGECRAVLHFLEYRNGRWSEEADGAPPFELEAMREIYRRKTGKAAKVNPYLEYQLSGADKTLTVAFGNGLDGDTVIYKLEWDGNIFDFAVPNEEND